MKCIYTNQLFKLCHFCYLVFFFVLPFISIAQEYSYTHYDSKDGLAGSTVYCAVQDKDGFLWFGTETGLSRFDGTHFKNFTAADGLPDTEIISLFVDSKNRVWILPFKNTIYYYFKGRIYNQQNDSVLKKIKITKSNIRSVIEGKDGNMLINEGDFYHIIKSNGEIIRENRIDGMRFHAINAGLNENGDFRLQLSSYEENNISCYVVDLPESKAPVWHLISNNSNSVGDYGILSPRLDVILKEGKLFFYPANRDSFSIPSPRDLINMVRLNDTLVAINAASRSLFFDIVRKEFIHEFLSGYRISAVLQDSEGNFWFTTMGDGIFRLGSTEFKNVLFSDNQSSLSVYSIHKSESGICVGTNNSLLWKINRHGNKISKFNIGENIEHVRVLSLVSDKKNNLFIGTDRGVFQFRAGNKSIVLQTHVSVKELIIHGGKLRAATAQGIIAVGEFKNNANTILSKRATCVFSDGQSLYVGTLNGLYELDGKNTIFHGEKHPLLSGRISAIARTGDGIYWITTYGEGIVGYKDNKVVANLREENTGITSNVCRNIFVSGNTLWVGTDKGLNKIDLNGDKYKVTKFTTADGLGSNIIHTICVDSGMVYVGTPRGLTYFDENKISQNSNCRLHITGITVSDSSRFFDITGFNLPNNQNNIRFEFVGISYRSTGDITYRYRLLGLDTTWKTSKETFLSYPSLPSGEYELQLMAINKFGVQSAMKHINFTIQKKLIEKIWFRALMVFAGIILTGMIVGFYMKQVRKKEKQKSDTLQKMAGLEQMALRAQMNPHFIFNSLNSIQQYVMDKDIAGANKFITDFASLIRQTLDFSSRHEISLAEELKYLSTYLALEKARIENKFEFEVRLCETIAVQDYYIPPMILQPFVENSVRHGMGYRKDMLGKITISIALKDEMLICIIEDNGVGRAIAGQFKKATGANHQSKGMPVTMARIDMINKNNEHKIQVVIDDLKDEQNRDAGTRVTVSFPVFNYINSTIE